ncbi:MAG: hypothetical protein ACYDA4_14980 [Ignavibacteriaceae bacterium]
MNKIIHQSDYLYQVKKADLQPGDEVQLITKNSVYFIKVDNDGSYIVSGGWFDKMSVSPLKTTITGCTWGGSVIKTDIIAACGLFLEFGNRLLTSTIQEIIYFPRSIKN